MIGSEPESTCSVDRATAPVAAEWDAFVRDRASASAYHQWAWRGIFEDVFGHACEYLVARRHGHVVGVLPLVKFRSRLFGRSLVSLPFVNYGGVIADDGQTAEALLTAACETAEAYRAKHVEMRHLTRQYPALACRQHKVAMRRSLEGTAEIMWAHLDRKVRNQIRKAEQAGLTTIEGGAELVPEFYEVFAHNMRDLGTPVYDRRLFEQVLVRFDGSARVFVVRCGNQPVAAGITYRFRDTAEIPWASSLRQYRTSCANMLLYWSMLAAATAAGCTELDFGRSTPNEGTYTFKKQWGTTAQMLCWEYAALHGREVPDHGPGNPRLAAAIATWKRVPVPIATWLGPHVVRNIP